MLADHRVPTTLPPHPQAIATGGHNNGRVGTIVHKEKHKGSFDIVHIKDAGERKGRRSVAARLALTRDVAQDEASGWPLLLAGCVHRLPCLLLPPTCRLTPTLAPAIPAPLPQPATPLPPASTTCL